MSMRCRHSSPHLRHVLRGHRPMATSSEQFVTSDEHHQEISSATGSAEATDANASRNDVGFRARKGPIFYWSDFFSATCAWSKSRISESNFSSVEIATGGAASSFF